MEPCFIIHEVPLAEPWRERVLVTREPPRDQRGEVIERGPCGFRDGVWTAACGRFASFWDADAFVRGKWPYLHRPISATTFWMPTVEYRRFGQ